MKRIVVILGVTTAIMSNSFAWGFSEMFTDMSDVVTDMTESIKDGVDEKDDTGTTTTTLNFPFGDVMTGMTDAMSDMTTNMTDAMTDVTDSFKDAVDTIKEDKD